MSTAVKVYYDPQRELPRIKSGLASSQLLGMNFDNVCISSFDNSNNGHIKMIINFENDASTSFIHATLLYNPDIGQYNVTSVSKNTTKPGNCMNSSQVTNSFTSVTTRYDYYQLTDNLLYHPEIDRAFVMFFVIAIVCLYFPYKIFARAFGRWFKI